MTLDGFIKHVFPDSAVRPMVDNEILQIVVFSIFFGVACAAMGARARIVLEAIEGLSHIILRVTGYVMKLAPLAVFCAMAATIAHQRPRHPGQLRQVHGRVLLRSGLPVAAADRGRVRDARARR